VFPRAADPDELVWAGRSPLAEARSRRAAAGMWVEPGLALVSQEPVAAALWDCLLPPGLGPCVVGRFFAGRCLGLAKGFPPPSW